MSMEDLVPEVIYVDGYDEEYRMLGDCGVRAIFRYPQIATMPTCTLEPDHKGPHDWDPEYVYEDDEDDWDDEDGAS